MTAETRARLPRHLAPWADDLAIFPNATSLALGGMLPPISHWLGTHARRAKEDGDLDGYDGIETRGPYERLLATQWALLDEVPEEFVRRAVMGEHLFLRPARTEQSEPKQMVALFDAGPDQLGAPRIAQLAFLLVLHQRAEESGADFGWAALQDPTLHASLDPRFILDFLDARSRIPLDAACIEAWRARFTDEDLWWVGGRHLRQLLPASARTIAIEDIIALDREPASNSRVRIEWTARPSPLELPLPPTRVAVRLLRDPFDVVVAQPERLPIAVDPTSDLYFASGGRRLYVRGRENTLLSIPVPNSTKATMGSIHAVCLPDGERAIGVGTDADRRTVVVTQDQKILTLHTLSRKEATIQHSEHFEVPDTSWIDGRLRGIASGSRGVFYVHLGHRIASIEGARLDIITALPADGSTAHRDCISWVKFSHGRPSFHRWRPADREPKSMVEFDRACPSRYRDEAAVVIDGSKEVAGYPISPTAWFLGTWRGGVEVPVSSSLKIVGCFPEANNTPACLLGVDATENVLVDVRPDGLAHLCAMEGRIMQIDISPASHTVAILDEHGSIMVHSLWHSQSLLNLKGTGSR